MKAKNKVVYVPPVYEEVQHEVTSVDDNNVPLRTSFHTDVSLLQRIDNMRVDAQTYFGMQRHFVQASGSHKSYDDSNSSDGCNE